MKDTMTDLNQNVKGQVIKKSKKEVLFDNLKTIFWALLIALSIRSLLIEPFRIPSASMVPSLQVGDFLFVSKYTYGYSKHSFPYSLPLVKGRVWAATPKIGDVIVFRLPQDTSVHYIKRVIGLPGDSIQVKGGRLFINNRLIPRRFISNRIYNSHVYKEYEETLPDGLTHLIYEMSDAGVADNTYVYTVPENMLMVMGDNRDNSTDSRFPQVGFIPLSNVIGKARFIFFSWENTFPFLRFKRFFNLIK